MTLDWFLDRPPENRDRNVLRFPVERTSPPETPEELAHQIDVDAAMLLLTPRSAAGPLFGLSRRDLDRAAARIRSATLPRAGLDAVSVRVVETAVGRRGLLLKRVLDVIMAASALVVLAPLFLAIAIAIRLDSPGPALFRQERVGQGGRRFSMLKFRSMVADADAQLPGLLAESLNDGAGPLFKLRVDPRVTRVGRILRRYSLDELPQLWNVFRGDMSLVGPRPPLPREVETYERHVYRRLYVKPGLTGLWQIRGRSDLSWEESVRLDLYYVENWSIIGDLAIMWRTVRVVTGPLSED